MSWDRLEAETGGSVLGVDAGTGCIYDASNRDVLEVLQADDERLDAVFVEVHSSRFATVDDSSGTPALVLFECGMGDGAYPVWIGRDPGATIVAILIDLELLSHASSRLEGTPR